MKRSIKSLLMAAALAAAAIGAAAIGTATESAHASPPLGADGSIADVTEKVLPSVVNVSTTTVVQRANTPVESDPFFEEFFGRGQPNRERYGQSLGSGVIVSSRGYILTNSHVVANGKDIQVSLSDGRELHARVVGADPKSDLAVLKLNDPVPANLKPLPFGDSDKLRLGDVVLAVGNPFGVGQAVTMGIVSAKGRANMGIVDYEDFIQTDAAINPGNSGGALINLRGELVGINTAILSRTGGYQGIGFAIPTAMARPIMDSLIRQGKVVRGWLGVSIRPITKELREQRKLSVDRGVMIAGVEPGGPAAKSGLREGDVVVRINNRPCDSPAQLRNAVAAGGVGKPVQMDIIRGGKRQTVSVVLGEVPSDQAPVVAQRGSQSGAAKLGIQVVPLDRSARVKFEIPRDVTHGVVVVGVDRGSVADQIGLRAGDVVLQVNRIAVKTARQLQEAYRRGGGALALLVYRDGQTALLKIEK
jgi:Do/DeqQ family serine protease